MILVIIDKISDAGLKDFFVFFFSGSNRFLEVPKGFLVFFLVFIGDLLSCKNIIIGYWRYISYISYETASVSNRQLTFRNLLRL